MQVKEAKAMGKHAEAIKVPIKPQEGKPNIPKSVRCKLN
jgi:hypothetical protein